MDLCVNTIGEDRRQEPLRISRQNSYPRRFRINRHLLRHGMTSPTSGHPPYSENESDCCFTCCCSTFCCLCRCTNINKSTRIKLVWTWLVILGVLSSVVLSCYLYRDDHPYSSPSDVRPVTKNVYFLFCEAVSIESNGISFDAFAVPNPLRVDPVGRGLITTKTALYIDVYDFNYFTLYLLTGSTLKLRHCSERIVSFYVFTGIDNFQEWRDNPNCEFCYDKKIYLLNSNNCNDDSEYQEYELEVESDSQMFFVYSNQDFFSAWVDLKLDINRTMYDMSDAQPVCTDALECSVELDGPEVTVVYHVDDQYDIGEADHPKFITECVPRVWAYFLIHGMAVLLIGITSSILIQKLCKDREGLYSRYTGYTQYGGSERTPLLYDTATLPPSYSSVALSPPKYEDIVRNCEDPPPYLAAVAALSDSHTGTNSVISGNSSVQADQVTWDVHERDRISPVNANTISDDQEQSIGNVQGNENTLNSFNTV